MADENPNPPREGGRDGRAVGIVLVVATLVLATILWGTTASDHEAPRSSRGVVSAGIAQIAPRVSGRVEQVTVRDNTIVDKGDVLFQIDARPFQIAVDRAKAALDEATQGVSASSAQIEAAQAQVARARAGVQSAQETADRTAELFKRGIAAKAANDRDQTALDAAKAALKQAQAAAEAARRALGDAGQNNPQIQAAELALEQAQYDLLSTKVVAPTAGVITNLHLDIGQFIGAGQPGVTFIDRESTWVMASLRENQLLNVDPGDRATFLFDALPGQIFTGQVESVAYGIEVARTEIQGLVVSRPLTQWFEPARRIPVRLILDGGQDAWPEKVRLGGKVDVVIQAQEQAGLIAKTAQLMQQLRSVLTGLY